MSLVEINLKGSFKSFHEGPIRVHASTIAEAIAAATQQIKGFKPDKNGRKRIVVPGYETVESLATKLSDDVKIDIFPQLVGGKKGGFLNILIGAVLIAAFFATGGASAPLMFGAFNASQFLIGTGVMLVLGGIASFLAPTPQKDRGERSRYLGAPRNTVQVGTPIPILYGEARAYGHFISFDINAKDTAI